MTIKHVAHFICDVCSIIVEQEETDVSNIVHPEGWDRLEITGSIVHDEKMLCPKCVFKVLGSLQELGFFMD